MHSRHPLPAIMCPTPIPRRARRLVGPLAAGLALVLCAAAGQGPGALEVPRAATHVVIRGELDKGTLAHLERGVRHARQERHRHLVVELDTPGGEVTLMWRLAKSVRAASEGGLLTVVWVSGNATSAGSLLALASDRLYMRTASTIGSATPVTFGPEGMSEAPEKVRSVVRAQFRAIAVERGRDPALAEAMVDPDVAVYEIRGARGREFVTGAEWNDLRLGQDVPELLGTVVREGELLNATGPEAVRLGLADGLSESLPELLSLVGCSGCQIVTLERRPSEDALGFLNRITPLLLLAGLWLGYTELRAPGFGLAGILSILCFAIVLLGQYLVGLADAPHLVLVALGVGLVAVELFLLPGTIWIGLVGGACVLVGLVAAQLGPGFEFSQPLDQQLLLDAAFQLVLLALGGIAGMWALARFLPEAPVLRHMVLSPDPRPSFAEALPDARQELARPGALGRSETPLRPVGSVVLDGLPDHGFEARADGDWIGAGVRVRVLEAQGGRLVVVADDAESGAPGGGAA